MNNSNQPHHLPNPSRSVDTRAERRSRLSLFLALALVFTLLPVVPVPISPLSFEDSGAVSAQEVTPNSTPRDPLAPTAIPGPIQVEAVTDNPYQLQVSWDASTLSDISLWWIGVSAAENFTFVGNRVTAPKEGIEDRLKRYVRTITPDSNGMVSTTIGLRHADFPADFLTQFGLEPATRYVVWVHAGKVITGSDVATNCTVPTPYPNRCDPDGSITVWSGILDYVPATTAAALTTTTISAPVFNSDAVTLTGSFSDPTVKLNISSLTYQGNALTGNGLDNHLCTELGQESNCPTRRDIIAVNNLDDDSDFLPHYSIDNHLPKAIIPNSDDPVHSRKIRTCDDIESPTNAQCNSRRFVTIPYTTEDAPANGVGLGILPGAENELVPGQTYTFDLIVSRQIRSGPGAQSYGGETCTFPSNTSITVPNCTPLVVGNRGVDRIPVTVMIDSNTLEVPTLASPSNFTVSSFGSAGFEFTWDEVDNYSVGNDQFQNRYELQYKRGDSSSWSNIISVTAINRLYTHVLLLNQSFADRLTYIEREDVKIVKTSSNTADNYPVIQSNTDYDFRIRTVSNHVNRDLRIGDFNRSDWTETQLRSGGSKEPYWRDDTRDIEVTLDEQVYRFVADITPVNPDDFGIWDWSFTIDVNNRDIFDSFTVRRDGHHSSAARLAVKPDIDLSELQSTYTVEVSYRSETLTLNINFQNRATKPLSPSVQTFEDSGRFGMELTWQAATQGDWEDPITHYEVQYWEPNINHNFSLGSRYAVIPIADGLTYRIPNISFSSDKIANIENIYKFRVRALSQPTVDGQPKRVTSSETQTIPFYNTGLWSDVVTFPAEDTAPVPTPTIESATHIFTTYDYTVTTGPGGSRDATFNSAQNEPDRTRVKVAFEADFEEGKNRYPHDLDRTQPLRHLCGNNAIEDLTVVQESCTGQIHSHPMPIEVQYRTQGSTSDSDWATFERGVIRPAAGSNQYTYESSVAEEPLTAGTHYEFRMRLVSFQGPGPWSDTTTASINVAPDFGFAPNMDADSRFTPYFEISESEAANAVFSPVNGAVSIQDIDDDDNSATYTVTVRSPQLQADGQVMLNPDNSIAWNTGSVSPLFGWDTANHQLRLTDTINFEAMERFAENIDHIYEIANNAVVRRTGTVNGVIGNIPEIPGDKTGGWLQATPNIHRSDPELISLFLGDAPSGAGPDSVFTYPETVIETVGITYYTPVNGVQEQRIWSETVDTDVLSHQLREYKLFPIRIELSDGLNGEGQTDTAVDDVIETYVIVTDVREGLSITAPVISGVANDPTEGSIAFTYPADVAENPFGIYIRFRDQSAGASDPWQVHQQRAVSGDTPIVIQGLAPGTSYDVEVNLYGFEGSQQHNLTFTAAADDFDLETPNLAPTAAENQTAVVTYSAPSAQTITTWELSGYDQDLFTISASGELSFVTAPNFEVPRDANRDGIYEVTVIARTATEVSFTSVQVSVTDVEEMLDPLEFRVISKAPTADVNTNELDVVIQAIPDDPTTPNVDESEATYTVEYRTVDPNQGADENWVSTNISEPTVDTADATVTLTISQLTRGTSYEVRVRAVSGFNTASSPVVTQQVVNSPPAFDMDSYSFEIDENNSADFGSVTATDPEGEAFTYSIDADATALGITIDQMGNLSPPSGGFDREALDSFDMANPTNPVTITFNVMAGTVTASVTVTVANVNEPPVISVNPTLTPIQLFSGREFQIDFEPGGVPYFTDPDGDDLVYEIYMEVNPRTDTMGVAVADTATGYDTALPAYFVEGNLTSEQFSSVSGITGIDNSFVSIEGTVASIIGGRTEQTHKDGNLLGRELNLIDNTSSLLISARDPDGLSLYDLNNTTLATSLQFVINLHLDAASRVGGPDTLYLAQTQVADTVVYPYTDVHDSRWEFAANANWPRWFLMDRSTTDSGDNSSPTAGNLIACYVDGSPSEYNAGDRFWSSVDEADHGTFDIGPNQDSRLETQTAVTYQAGGDNSYNVVVGAFSADRSLVNYGCDGHAQPIEIEVLDITPPAVSASALPSATTVDAAGNIKVFSGRTTNFATNSHQGSGEAGTWFAYDTTAFPADQIDWSAIARHDSVAVSHDSATGVLGVTPSDVGASVIVPIRLEVDNSTDVLPALLPSGDSANTNATLHTRTKEMPAQVVPLAQEFTVQIEPEPLIPHALHMLVGQQYEIDISDWFDIRAGSMLTINDAEIGTQAMVTLTPDVANGTAELSLSSANMTSTPIDLTITHVNGMITDSLTIPMSYHNPSAATATYKIPAETDQSITATDILTTAAGQTLRVFAMTSGEASVSSTVENEFTVTSGTIPQGSDTASASVVFIPTDVAAVTDNPPYILYELEVEALPSSSEVLTALTAVDVEVDLSDYFFFNRAVTPNWILDDTSVDSTLATITLDAPNNSVAIDGLAETSTNQTFTISHGTDVGGTVTADDWVFPASVSLSFEVLDAPYRPLRLSIPNGAMLTTPANTWFNVTEGTANFELLCDPAGTLATSCSAADDDGQNYFTASLAANGSNTELTLNAGPSLTIDPIALTIDSGLRNANAGEASVPETIDLDISVVANQYQALVGSDLVLDLSDWFFHNAGSDFSLDAVSGDTAVVTVAIDTDEELTITPLAAGVTTVTISRQSNDDMTVSPETYTIDITVVTQTPTPPPMAADPLVLFLDRTDTVDVSQWFVTNEGFDAIWTLTHTDTGATLTVGDNTLTATGNTATADGVTETFTITHDQAGIFFPASQTISYVVRDAPYSPEDLTLPQGESFTIDVAQWFSIGSSSEAADYMILCDPAGTLSTSCSAPDSSYDAVLTGSSLVITATDTLTTDPVVLTIDSGLRNNVTGQSAAPETLSLNISVVSNDYNLLVGHDLVLDLAAWFYHQDGSTFGLDVSSADEDVATVAVDVDNQLTITPVGVGTSTLTVSRQTADDGVVEPPSREIMVTVFAEPASPPNTATNAMVLYINQEQEFDVSQWFVSNPGVTANWTVAHSDTSATITLTDNTLTATGVTETGSGVVETFVISHDQSGLIFPDSQTISYVVSAAPYRPTAIDLPQNNSIQVDVSAWFTVGEGSAAPNFMVSCDGGALESSCSAGDGSFTATLSGSDLTITSTQTLTSAPVTLTVDSGLRNANTGEEVVPETADLAVSVVKNSYNTLVGSALSVDAGDWFFHSTGASFSLDAASSDPAVAAASVDSSGQLTINPVAAGRADITISRQTTDDATVIPASYQLAIRVAEDPVPAEPVEIHLGRSRTFDVSRWFVTNDGTVPTWTLTHTDASVGEADLVLTDGSLSANGLVLTPDGMTRSLVISHDQSGSFFPDSQTITYVVVPAPAGRRTLSVDDFFADDADTTHEANINLLAHFGVSQGCNPPTNSSFCPFREITRGEMATFIVRIMDLGPTSADWFDDDNGTTHEDAINRLGEARLTFGCNPSSGGRLYCPFQPITRGELASFLSRALDLSKEKTGFTDIAGNIHQEQIRHILAEDISRGCNPPDNDRFCPNRSVTRGEMASMLVRAFPRFFR